MQNSRREQFTKSTCSVDGAMPLRLAHVLPLHRGTFWAYNLFSVHWLCCLQFFQNRLTSRANTSVCGCRCCRSGGIEPMVLESFSTKTFPPFVHMESRAFLRWMPGMSGTVRSGVGGTCPLWTWYERKLTHGWCQFLFLFLWNKISDILSEELYQLSLPKL